MPKFKGLFTAWLEGYFGGGGGKLFAFMGYVLLIAAFFAAC